MNLLFRRAIPVLATLALWIGLANPGRADVILYTNRAAFNDATTAATTFNFDSLTPQNSFVLYGSSVTTNGMTFTTTNNSLYAIGRDYLGGVFAFNGANAVLQDNLNPSNLTATLPPGVTAFGVDLGSEFTITGTGTLTLASGTNFSFPITIPGRPNLGFFGVTSDSPITSFTITTGDFGLSFADVTRATAVPEPSSMALFVLSGVALAGFRRLSRRSE
jgi:hypothetical protein